MEKTKEKVEIEEGQGAKVGEEIFVKDSPDNEAQERVAFWKEEINSILGQEFATMQEAIDLIASKVVSRLGFEGEEADKTAQFIRDVLSGDEEAQNQLRAVLDIRESA